MRKAIKIVSDILFTAGLITAGLFLVARFTGKMPLKVYIVSSGSMEPAIQTGGIVFVVPQKSYQTGNVITFKTGSKSTTTHRIVGVGPGQFRVAGDANNAPDPGLVDADKVLGVVRLYLPYLGYIANFAKTPRGFILLVIVPATIIIYEELKSLIHELKNKIKSQVKNPRSVESGPNLSTPNATPAIILPIFFALLIPLTLTISYFIDRETSAGNSFMRSPSPPTPLLNETVTGPTPTLEPTATPTPTLEPTITPTPTSPIEVLPQEVTP